MADKRFYWLRLQKDFFKRHDVKIIKAMPNGKDYLIFYLTLLCESITHEGRLRFSDTVPYNEEMLSVITDTNIDVVRSAMKVFIELKMIEILDDETIFMSQMESMIGGESWSAERMRRLREKQKLLPVTSASQNVTCDEEKEIEKELDIEIDKKENIKEKSADKPQTKIFISPSVEEVNAYCKERNNGIDAEHFVNFYESKGWLIGKNKMKDWKAAVRTWESKNKADNSNTTSKQKPKQWKINIIDGQEVAEEIG